MKSTKISLLLLCILFAGVSANAQRVATPVLSFVADDAHNLRPLIGVAGAASVGEGLNLGFNIDQAAIPPHHEYVIATTGDDRRAVFVDLRASTLSPQFINAFGCDSDEEILRSKGRASQC